MRNVFGTALRALAAASFAMAFTLSEASAQSGNPIRIGMSLALTGAGAAPSKVINTALDIWRDDINAKGGLLGRPVRVTDVAAEGAAASRASASNSADEEASPFSISASRARTAASPAGGIRIAVLASASRRERTASSRGSTGVPAVQPSTRTSVLTGDAQATTIPSAAAKGTSPASACDTATALSTASIAATRDSLLQMSSIADVENPG